MALVDRVSGVSDTSPPKSLKWETLPAPTKKQRSGIPLLQVASDDVPVSQSEVANLMTELISERNNKEMLMEAASFVANHPMIEYLKFLALQNVDAVHKVLIDNSMLYHSIFAKGNPLERGKLHSLGLDLGVATALFDGVARFELSLEIATEI
ncbi:hypothetical protein MJO29_006100 [Puccinia striiformis f. sp. tritici]|uniref:Uncharacterized protein n=1 Tax=Puccinia striiformis f. sp. tritici PST-78 TaxID=1165861 RepID=A0A0L0V526_9BASI|nr:hypothetical protein Pst134EA_011315 [Puccinia striiformis f. sp. tritici]KAH9467680.1 hypothetical protein Pst134EA_011315 [Puccinia striiformis f. sp. tritici]KAI7957883.1 hypothetical protein MJO29_006100 [Puccinia striiformis f. sp. tritici]KNE94079.1 hypothetical protein PSTG_12589 [Puccinia striiformis f. sp. tritici PST-78]